MPRYKVPEDFLQDQLLCELSSMFIKNGSYLASFNLTSRKIPIRNECLNRLILEELSYDAAKLAIESESLYQKLNDEQRNIYFEILGVVHAKKEEYFLFLDMVALGKLSFGIQLLLPLGLKSK